MPQMTQNIAKISNAVQCHSWLSGNKDCNDFRFSIVITFDPELQFRFPRWVSESTDRRGSAGEVRNLSGDFRNTEIRCGNTRNTVCNATSARSFSASRTPILLSEVSFGIYGSTPFCWWGQKSVRGRQKYRNTLWKYKKYSLQCNFCEVYLGLQNSDFAFQGEFRNLRIGAVLLVR